MKNEAPYIKEWLEYHLRIVGVEHFYLYDNESKDNTSVILRPYIDKGIVTCIPICGLKRQHDAYNDALNRFGNDTKYMAFIDLDEFIFTDGKKFPEYLDERICDDSKEGAVVVNWLLFGSAGFAKKPEGLVIENYVKRAEYDFKKNWHIKTICNPRKTLAFVNAHYAIYKHGAFAINTTGDRVAGAESIPTKGGIKIYHYFTKSREEFEEKRLRGKADDGKVRAVTEFKEHDVNDVEDISLKKFVPYLYDLR